MKTVTYPRLGETVVWHTLPNGLPVCVVRKSGFSRKYALFATRYGGMDLRFQLHGEWLDTPAGIAHYLEHKMFDTAEGNALQELAQNGAEPNAFTSNAMTAYYFDCTDHFSDNLKILLSFVSVPYFTDESVAKEQGIIGQEIGMIEDNPEWQVYKRLMQILYRTSPARISVAGSVESISHITAQTLYDCHKAFYTPANMCLVVVGDVEPEEVFRTAEEILPRESGPVIPRDYGAEEDLLPMEKETRCTMEVSMPTFLVGFKCPNAPEGEERLRNNTIGDLACDILMGDSSALFARLYADGLVNGSFGCSYDLLPGVAYVYAGGDSNEPQKVVDAILEEAQRMVREGIDEDYYQRVRKAVFGTTLKALNSFESIAVSAAEGCFNGFDAYRFPEVFDSITKQDLIDFIRDNIVAERAAISVITPREAQEA
ncbi:MAG: insulinase family protein [Clostridiales bacterium]|nr:insulinase family protein [Candidatus Cacconaster stercorequi]